jgi:hypothetical protein
MPALLVGTLLTNFSPFIMGSDEFFWHDRCFEDGESSLGQEIMIKKIKEAVLGLRVPVRLWHRKPKHLLRICENVSLGERSSVAVLQFEQQRFLVGVTGSSMSLLAKLTGNDCKDGEDNVPTWVWKEGLERESA